MKKHLKTIVVVLVLVMLCSMMFVACNKNEVKPGFYRLQEAYDLGLIDMQDLKSIAHYQNNGIYDEGEFVPTPKDPETLTDEQTQELLVAFTKACIEGLYNEPDDGEKLLKKYYGTYNGHIVARFGHMGHGYFFMIDEREIEGVRFYFPQIPETIYVWVK